MKKRVYKGREVTLTNSNQLIKQTNKLIEEANKRLIKLTKGIDINKSKYDPTKKKYIRTTQVKNIVKFDYDTWASKKLYDRLMIDKGLIPKLSGKDNNTKVLLTNKAVKNFLSSKTSSIKGIRGVIENTKESIRNVVTDFEDDDISDQDIEKLYSFLNDHDFNKATQYLDPSELWVTLNETKEAGGTEDDFLRRIENYIYSDSLYKDEDLVESLTNIYNKYRR